MSERGLKGAFLAFVIVVVGLFWVMTFKEDKLRLNVAYQPLKNRESDVTVEDSRSWWVREGRPAGDVLVGPVYARKKGSYTLEIPVKVSAAGSGVRIEADGILMPDNTIVKTVLPFTEFRPGEDLFRTEFTVPDDCRELRLIVSYGGSGECGVWSAHYESRGLYYRDAAFLAVIIGSVLLFAVMVRKKRGWRISFFRGDTGAFSPFGVMSVCILSGFIASLDLTGKPIYRGADLQFHLERLIGLAEALKWGQFPVRMQPFWHFDGGYPVSVFYPDILLYPAAVLLCLGMSEYYALCLTVYVMNVMTAYIGYRSYTRLLGDEQRGMMASVLYTCAMWRLIILYQGFGLGALLSMMFFPMVLSGVYEVLWGEEERWPVLAFGMTGVLSGHILSATHAVLLCLICAFGGFRQLLCKNRAFAVLRAIGMTTLLNLWFIVPFLTLVGNNINMVRSGTDIRQTMVFLPQMFQWIVNTAGRENLYGNETAGEMPLTLGIVLGIGLILYLAVRIHDRKPVLVGDLSVLLTAVALWISSEFFPWEFIHRVPLIGTFLLQGEFSWRYYSIAAVALPITAAIAFSRLMEGRVSRGVSILLVMIAAILNAAPFLDSVPQNYEAFFLDKYRYEFDFINHTENRDYLYYGMSKQEILDLSRTADAEGADVTRISRRGVDLDVMFTKPAGEARVVLPVFSYPVYRVTVQGKTAATEETEHHRIMVRLPEEAAADGMIRVRFREPLLWRVSEIISLLSVLALLLWLRRRSAQGFRFDKK